MRNGSVIFGYSVENGRAVVDEVQAGQIRKIFDGYISGLSNTEAAKAAGIELTHSTVKRLMQDKHYLGDDFYPAVIDMETFNAAEEERRLRSRKLGRDNLKRKSLHPQSSGSKTLSIIIRIPMNRRHIFTV